ncbi:MAG: hypothetical protein Q7S63_01815 [bacterium]|nr:hypothetical protein [bacterium]
MKVIYRENGDVSGIKDLQGDMREDVSLDLIEEGDGDVILTLYDKEGESLSIQFCSGGSGNPIVSAKLRELIHELHVFSTTRGVLER